MPLLAISFLAMGLACTGFPGTLGFVGQELLVDGAVDAFPVMGFGVVIASALLALPRAARSTRSPEPALWAAVPRGMDVRCARDPAHRLRVRASTDRRFAI